MLKMFILLGLVRHNAVYQLTFENTATLGYRLNTDIKVFSFLTFSTDCNSILMAEREKTDGEVEEVFLHVKYSYMIHLEEHPSPSFQAASSQFSPNKTSPSPHLGTHPLLNTKYSGSQELHCLSPLKLLQVRQF